MSTPIVRLLMICQSPALVYACLAVKREAVSSIEDRKRQSADTYESFDMEAWMEWLLKDADFQLPPWIPRRCLGDLPSKVRVHGMAKRYPNAGAPSGALTNESGRVKIAPRVHSI